MKDINIRDVDIGFLKYCGSRERNKKIMIMSEVLEKDKATLELDF